MWSGMPSVCDDDQVREWRFYIQDMIGFSEKVLSYSAGLDQEALVADERTYDAILRNLELIGEAATHIPGDVRDAHPEVPWHAIIGTRNRLLMVTCPSATALYGASSATPCRGCCPRCAI